MTGCARTTRAGVEAHLARMLAFDFEPGLNEWRRACATRALRRVPSSEIKPRDVR